MTLCLLEWAASGARGVVHWLDITIAVIVALPALAGWRLGFVRKAVLLLAVSVGVAVAGAYHERVIIDLAIAETPTAEMRFASFAAIVAVVVVLGAVAGLLLRGAAGLLMLGWADRSAGLVFGAAVGVLIVQALIAVAIYAPLPGASAEVGQSRLGAVMMDNVPVVRALLPGSFDLAIHEFLFGLDEVPQSLGL